MKEYLKPEVELISFAMEDVANNLGISQDPEGDEGLG